MEFTHKQMETINKWATRKDSDLSDSENINYTALKRMVVSKVTNLKQLKEFVRKIKTQKSGLIRSAILAFIAKVRSYLHIEPTRKENKFKKYRGIASGGLSRASMGSILSINTRTR